MVVPQVRRAWIPAGVAAGVAGAIVMDAFLLAVPWPGVPLLSPAQHYTSIATTLVGSTAAGAAWAVPLGVVAHLLIAIGWAFGYLYAAQYQPQLLQRPLVSGFVFGIIVWLIMLLLLLAYGKFAPPTFFSFDHDIIAHTLFFGIPLAYVAARLARTA